MLGQKIWLGMGPRGKGEWRDVESAEKCVVGRSCWGFALPGALAAMPKRRRLSSDRGRRPVAAVGRGRSR